MPAEGPLAFDKIPAEGSLAQASLLFKKVAIATFQLRARALNTS
jgi:hypothetical protein